MEQPTVNNLSELMNVGGSDYDKNVIKKLMELFSNDKSDEDDESDTESEEDSKLKQEIKAKYISIFEDSQRELFDEPYSSYDHIYDEKNGDTQYENNSQCEYDPDHDDRLSPDSSDDDCYMDNESIS
jgi:hypothetical protein